MFDIEIFRAAKPAARKIMALEAFQSADPTLNSTDWQAIATALAECVTTRKAKTGNETGDGYAPWHDVEGKMEGNPTRGKGRQHTYRTMFTDGRIVRASVLQEDEGKATNAGRAMRVLVAFYRYRIEREAAPNPGVHNDHIAVPEVHELVNETTGERWNPDTVNRETGALRAGVFDLHTLRESAEALGLSPDHAAYAIRAAFLAGRKGTRVTDLADFIAEVAETAPSWAHPFGSQPPSAARRARERAAMDARRHSPMLARLMRSTSRVVPSRVPVYQMRA